MGVITIDILNPEDDETDKKPSPEITTDEDMEKIRRTREVRKQLITIDGDIVDG